MSDNAVERYPKRSIPDEELEVFAKYVREHSDHWDTAYARDRYAERGLTSFLDPFARDLLDPAKEALIQRRPFSAVRIADGEANILTFGAYEGTPNLDRHAFAASIGRQEDSFHVNDTWMLVLRDLMRLAVLSADLVGVLGLWRPAPLDAPTIDVLRKRPRGVTGHFRGIDLMLRWATEGRFASHSFAPTHLYFSVLLHLGELMALTDTVMCITGRQPVVEALRQRFPNLRFQHIMVGNRRGSSDSAVSQPGFLSEVEAELPDDMSGCLCLIGAGVWAEFYGTWVKQRGGVAIDIGSGFDLLAGVSSRPVHTLIPEATIASLKITND